MYLEDAEAGRLLTRRGIAEKASTLATDRDRVETHIRPLMGTMKVDTSEIPDFRAAWALDERWSVPLARERAVVAA